VVHFYSALLVYFTSAFDSYLLKWEYKLLGHLQKSSKIIEVGKAVVELMCLVYSRKDTTKGTPIHSQSKAVKQLLRGNKIAFVDELFKRTDGYYAGNTSKKWMLTKLSETILEQTIDIFFDRFNDLCPYNCTTYSSICNSVKRTSLEVTKVRELSLTSILNILSLAIGYEETTKSLIVSLEHTSNTDETLGRTYNLFSRLRSKERTSFDYIAYDISSALQTICLQLVEGSKESYPILYQYSSNKGYKVALRASIADDLNIPISDVKAKLTAFANGGISGKDKHPIYLKFQEESDRLRREVLSHTASNNAWLLEESIAQSKRNLTEEIDWFSLNAEDSQSMARNKSSVFFFLWTYYERLIRQAMLKVIPNGIEVHDAVYSKDVIDLSVIENRIFKDTGFRVQITN